MAKWEFGFQVGGSCLSVERNGNPALYVTQPASYVKLHLHKNQEDVDEAMEVVELNDDDLVPNATTEILGGLSRDALAGTGADPVVAMASNDGVLALVRGSSVLWKVKVIDCFVQFEMKGREKLKILFFEK